MKTRLAFKKIPTWQIERAGKIHRACRRMRNALARGEKITKATRRASHYYNRRILNSSPSRRLLLTPQTLRRLFQVWKTGGESPSALIIKYHVRRPAIPAPLLIRFVNFCASNRLPSVKDAWQQFSAARRNARQTRGISYGQVCYSFPAADFYQMQAHLKAGEKSLGKLDQIRFKVISDITNHLPPRTPGRLTKAGANFEI
ncbi:MAG: hypothetical protein WCK57_07105 [Verrucomicrobiae bacterium]